MTCIYMYLHGCTCNMHVHIRGGLISIIDPMFFMFQVLSLCLEAVQDFQRKIIGTCYMHIYMHVYIYTYYTTYMYMHVYISGF